MPVLCVAGALLLADLLQPYLLQSRLIPFFGAVIVATAVAGAGAGVLCTALSVFVFEFFVLGTGVQDGWAALVVRDGLFLAASGGYVYLIAHLQRARKVAEQLSGELEARAIELESQVLETELQAADMEQLTEDLESQSEVARAAAAQAEQLQRLTTRLQERAGAVSMGAVILTETRRLLGAYAGAVGTRRADDAFDFVAAEGYGQHLLLADSDVHRLRTPIAHAVRTGEGVWVESREELEERFPDLLPHILPQSQAWVALPLVVERRNVGVIALSYAQPEVFTPRRRQFMEQVAQQCAQALERARLYELELRARVRAEFAERRVAFLANASVHLGAALDEQAIIDALAGLTVPEIADWCLVHGTGVEGPTLRAVRHMDPARVEMRRDMDRRFGQISSPNTVYARVFRTGEPEHIETVTDEDLRAIAVNDEHFQMMRSVGVRSVLAVPIHVKDGVAAVMTLLAAESGRSFTGHDVTLAVELARRAGHAMENARLYRAAQIASESKSDFLAVMSHELRTPLNAIIGYSDLLLLGVPDAMTDRSRAQVERIRRASDSLLALVDEVLSFSRIEAGHEEIRISPVNLGGLVADCVGMVEPLAGEKDIELIFDAPPQRVKLISDEMKIRQIVTNLLSNALKFTEQGTVVARVFCTDHDAVVEVSDTGIGIMEEHLEQIFEPFWQVEQSATRRYGGTGLGLGVARRLAALLHGHLVAESQPGVGSTFRLTLPLRIPSYARNG